MTPKKGNKMHASNLCMHISSTCISHCLNVCLYSHTLAPTTVAVPGAHPGTPVPQVHVIQGPHVTTERHRTLQPAEPGRGGTE